MRKKNTDLSDFKGDSKNFSDGSICKTLKYNIKSNSENDFDINKKRKNSGNENSKDTKKYK